MQISFESSSREKISSNVKCWLGISAAAAVDRHQKNNIPSIPHISNCRKAPKAVEIWIISSSSQHLTQFDESRIEQVKYGFLSSIFTLFFFCWCIMAIKVYDKRTIAVEVEQGEKFETFFLLRRRMSICERWISDRNVGKVVEWKLIIFTLRILFYSLLRRNKKRLDVNCRRRRRSISDKEIREIFSGIEKLFANVWKWSLRWFSSSFRLTKAKYAFFSQSLEFVQIEQLTRQLHISVQWTANHIWRIIQRFSLRSISLTLEASKVVIDCLHPATRKRRANMLLNSQFLPSKRYLRWDPRSERRVKEIKIINMFSSSSSSFDRDLTWRTLDDVH